ncbi:AAA family ATPase [Bacillus sp. 1813sda1]|uniref:Endonuclease GajA/Old nuclease/RecF-like AAA domain-containing protein n=1 Tax=Bacillus wiedmannii TaxID=1890302 RepID=A0AB37Z1T3_9BACI|nr:MULTISPECIES: AAA family ATPase [Bacillus]MCP1166781.1 AAA family ATPase [Bacillus sp. 1813sda1]MDC7973142.1 AAA family ATPase [Bacillus sp. BLCC-B18]SCC68919.1 Uncharacterized protein BC10311_06211 [Bacillus wiedmannii]
MKLKSLYIEEFRNLKQFTIDFQKTTSFIQAIIGKNGSGKSNLLEAIVTIFKGMVLEESPQFNFEMSYIYNAEEIKVSGVKGEGFTVIYRGFESDLGTLTASLLHRGESIYPENIVLYYSGVNLRLRELVKVFEESFIGNLDKKLFTPRRFFYVVEEHYSLFLLALLSSELKQIRSMLEEKFSIYGLKSFEIFLNTNYRHIGGELEQFISLLWEEASEKIGEKNGIRLRFSDAERSLYRIRDTVGYERDILKWLDACLYSNCIVDVHIELKKDEFSSTIISHKELSEGEQQLLLLTGLAEFFGYKESLYLWDEPDTFLHPKWQRELTNHIEGLDVKQQFILTTHSPNLLTTMDRENVFILEQGRVCEVTPYTLGRDINSILYELMGVSLRHKPTQKNLDEFYSLVENAQFTEAETILQKLISHMGNDDTEIVHAQNILALEKEFNE